MRTNIKTIKLGGVAGNCYLVKTKMGFILIATGEKIECQDLERELSQLACTSHNLNLIIFTHRESFNNSNYERLRENYKAKIAMHVIDESLIDEEESKTILDIFINSLKRVFLDKNKAIEFKPDLIIDEGTNLSLYGLNARVLFLPGYSNSVGILTENGELFCDDIIANYEKDCACRMLEMRVLKKLKRFLVDIVYTSHGKPFQIQALRI